ncbi:MAG: phosphotransferase, partial [Nakamurella sp.]
PGLDVSGLDKNGGQVTEGYGTAIWSSPEWQDAAVAWMDEQLLTAGIQRTGPVQHPHIRPWATVIRAPTSTGVVWLKATGPGTSFEVRLYPLLAALVPDDVLTPIAADPHRGWILLPDGGPSIGERLTGPALGEALVAALVQYAHLQVTLADHTSELLATGVSDMRPAVMPERFEQVLEIGHQEVARSGLPADRAQLQRVAGLRGVVVDWCAELAESRLPPSLDHNDLHPWNILTGAADHPLFYDWGDSVLAHPFAAMLVPLGFVRELFDVPLDDPLFQRARDGYLDVFRQLAPGEDLVSTLETACRVAKIARVLTWERALVAAREQDEVVRDDYQQAPLQTLFSLLDESYLGGA